MTRARRATADDDVLALASGRLSERDLALFGYSADTKKAITKIIELSPVLEDAILQVADLAYGDGQDSMSLC